MTNRNYGVLLKMYFEFIKFQTQHTKSNDILLHKNSSEAMIVLYLENSVDENVDLLA